MSSYVRHHRYHHLFKYPNSSVWWMFLPNPNGGKQLRESTRQHDDVAANKVYLERVRRTGETGAVDGASSKKERSLATALNDRIDWLKVNRETNDPSRKKLSQATIEFYEKKGGTLCRILGEHTLLSAITPERLREYVTLRTREGVKGSAIEKEITTLSMAMKLAKKDGVECSFVRDIKPEDFKTTYVPKERWLSKVEYDRFMAWWYGHRAPSRGAVLDFIVATGSTCPSEVYNTGRKDIDLKTFEVHIRGTKREKRDRTFIVPSDRREYLERAMKHADGQGNALFTAWGNIRRDILIACAYLSMCKTCQVAHNLHWYNEETDSYVKGTAQVMGAPCRDPDCGTCAEVDVFEPFCPTDLRRTFAQWLMRAGVPYELAYPLMGHNDDRMLKLVYGKRSATDVGPLIEAVLSQKKKERRAALKAVG